MARKTVIWIIIAVLALALVAAVGIAFGAGRQASSAVISQVRPTGLVNPLLPIRPGRLVGPFVQLPGSGPAVRIVAPIGGRGFRGLGLLLALLVGGGIGALITYLVKPNRNEAAAIAAPTPGSGRPCEAQWQQFQQWQQFEQWHRQMHSAPASEAPTAPIQPVTETLPTAPSLPDIPAQE